MKKVILLGVLSVVVVPAISALTPPIIGTPQTGLCHPASLIPEAAARRTISGMTPTVGYQDAANRDIADFSSGSELVITDQVLEGTGNSSILLTFTDSAFTGPAKISDSFPNGGWSESFSGHTITLNWAGGTVTSGSTYTATFVFAPEPSTWMLGLTGLAAMVLLLRRR